MRRIILLVFLLLSINEISVGQSHWCSFGPGSRINTSSQCSNYNFWSISSYSELEYLRERRSIDTLVVGNILYYFPLSKNTSKSLVGVKTLIIGTKASHGIRKLGGVSNLVSYFDCDFVWFPAIPDLRYKDTLDFGNAKNVFLRAFQLPVISKMNVIRNNRVDTIFTNAYTDSFIVFHGRRVFLKTDVRHRPPNR